MSPRGNRILYLLFSPQDYFLLSAAATSESPASRSKVAQNFAWTALEMILLTLGTLAVGIAVARTIGPRRLAYFNYVYWLTTAGSLLGCMGIPGTTFKYMGELLGSGENGAARAVYRHTLRLQAMIAIVIASCGLVAVLLWGDPQYRLVSLLMVVSVVPQMLGFIPSQANRAAEDFRANTLASLGAEFLNMAGIVASLLLHWNLVGIAATILLCRTGEFIGKAAAVSRRQKGFPNIPLPEHLRRRMWNFTGLGTGLLLLQVIVWDRSDIIFLKWLATDIRQVAFFSISFTLADRLLQIPQAFGSAVGATQMAEYGRDRQKLFRITGVAGIYVLMAAMPMLVGAACLSAPLVSTIYGSQYLPAISVFTLVAILAIPKAVLAPAQSLLYSTEELGFLLKWGCLSGVVNIALDVLLIPHMGARGAALGNGLAQAVAAVGIWSRAFWRHPVRIDVKAALKVLAATLLMVAVVVPIARSGWPGPLKLVLGIAAGAVVYLSAIRIQRVFSREDRQRLVYVTMKIPKFVGRTAILLVNFIAPVPSTVEASS
ncbi:MAG: polysaccharide biosynthesis C-terminal domain-containing protein [Acidobacteria bacterium]|nr:polysaccharide biosynthesis C-terminal domain-containing protein [Acidobacteriota bacterium]